MSREKVVTVKIVIYPEKIVKHLLYPVDALLGTLRAELGLRLKRLESGGEIIGIIFRKLFSGPDFLKIIPAF